MKIRLQYLDQICQKLKKRKRFHKQDRILKQNKIKVGIDLVFNQNNNHLLLLNSNHKDHSLINKKKEGLRDSKTLAHNKLINLLHNNKNQLHNLINLLLKRRKKKKQMGSGVFQLQEEKDDLNFLF